VKGRTIELDVADGTGDGEMEDMRQKKPRYQMLIPLKQPYIPCPVFGSKE